MNDSGSLQAEVLARQALRSWFATQPIKLRPLGMGHINTTWEVELLGGAATGQQRFVLQKVNRSVFSEPAELMANLDQLFTSKVVTNSTGLNYVLPQPLPTSSGALLVNSGTEMLSDGQIVDCQWRLAAFIEDGRTLQSLSNTRQAEAAGRAFGDFQLWLESLESVSLVEVIPGFHQLDGYLQALRRAASSANVGGDPYAARERLLLGQLQTRDYFRAAQPVGVANGVIHGDCKVNNLLFAGDVERVIAILDLDTLMRGPWWLDFGDLVRSAACGDTGEFQRQFYSALAEGFFTSRAGIAGFADADLNDALRAPAHMTFMLCVRFMTDHLQDDRYFKVEQHGDNFRRAERQFRLLETLESEDTKNYMRGVLKRYF